jgi:hypothetical protein
LLKHDFYNPAHNGEKIFLWKLAIPVRYRYYLLQYLGWEIWLSPVIQATWEARVVGWFEVERSPH